MEQKKSLNIAVVGCGGIGSAFAFHLASFGAHAVTVIGRPGSKRYQELVRHQAIVKASGDRAKVRVCETLDEKIPYDLVLVTLKAYQVDAVLPTLKLSTAKEIQFMFNNFEPERLQNLIGSDRCTFGMPFIQASIDKGGKLVAAIGATGQKTLIEKKKWVDVFNAAGLPAALEPNMMLWLKCHVPLCIAFESVSVAGVRRGNGASWSEAMILAGGVKESFTLIGRLGFKIYPRTKNLMSASPKSVIAGMLWGMSRIKSFRELLATGVDECRALTDVLILAGTPLAPPLRLEKIRAMKPD